MNNFLDILSKISGFILDYFSGITIYEITIFFSFFLGIFLVIYNNFNKYNKKSILKMIFYSIGIGIVFIYGLLLILFLVLIIGDLGMIIFILLLYSYIYFIIKLSSNKKNKNINIETFFLEIIIIIVSGYIIFLYFSRSF